MLRTNDMRTPAYFRCRFLCPDKAEGPMLLTISTTHRPAADLSFLLHKHPDRCQTFDLSFGKARVFYPESGDERCTVCLLLDVDPVGMVRGRNANSSFELAQYVND